ncbi:AAA family ATPase [Rhodopseudomonas palustris]|uniref:AAA family ATPase n=1 Tax=Rhodopseudomonas palustris TaxID=1076 RepID=UPI0015FF432A|nr:AAA family ATPase [Rhodopseudomonas palustris]
MTNRNFRGKFLKSTVRLLGASIKTVYITGAPASGKTTAVEALKSHPRLKESLEVWSYSSRLMEFLNRHSADAIDHGRLRQSSASLVRPEEIEALDAELLVYVEDRRGKNNILIDSHPVTREDYGFRCTSFSAAYLAKIGLDEIWMLYTDAKTSLLRVLEDKVVRKPISEEAAEMHTSMQASLAIAYGVAAGCPVYFFDTGCDQSMLVDRLALRL